jgi:hypothetical protein
MKMKVLTHQPGIARSSNKPLSFFKTMIAVSLALGFVLHLTNVHPPPNTPLELGCHDEHSPPILI